MRPKSLSATSALVYEACPARWKAEYLEKAPQPSGSAAALGTACHSTLERFVVNGGEKLSGDDAAATIRLLYEQAYREEFGGDNDRYDEGLEMCLRWAERQDWTDRVVLTTEVKKSFDIPLPDGSVIPFNYIMDRFDLLEGPHQEQGRLELEVVDYKTFSLPVTPESLRKKLQARCYALAAQIEYPEATRIWVTFDLLRYEPVGTAFNREDNAATWKYLKALAARIYADTEAPEKLNTECRWCIRKHECELLNSHVAAGGVLGISDPREAADRRARLAAAKTALDPMIGELDVIILEHAEAEGITEFSTDETAVEVTARGTRTVDPKMLARIIGPEMILDATNKVPISFVDDLLKAKDSRLTDTQKSQVRQLVRKTFGSPYVKTSPLSTIDDD